MKKVLLGILIGILLCGIGFGVYYYFFMDKDKEEVNTKTKQEEPKKEEVKNGELDINNSLVQELYSSVDASKDVIAQTIFTEKEKVTIEDLKEEQKEYLGFRLVPKVFTEQISCSQLNITSTYKGINADCGENSQDGYTTTIDESVIKRYSEKVFGPNTYKQVDRIFLISGYYQYDSNTQKYVAFSFNGGGYSYLYNEKLVKALKNDKTIELTIELTANTESSDAPDENILGTYKHTFSQNEDGNYYWTSIEKVS